MKKVKDLYEYLRIMLENEELSGEEDIILLQDTWGYCREFEKNPKGLLLKMNK